MSFIYADVAQLVEQLICNQRVGGSNPLASSSNEGGIAQNLGFTEPSFAGLIGRKKKSRADSPVSSLDSTLADDQSIAESSHALQIFGEVVERLMALGCKPSVLRDYGGSNPPLSTMVFGSGRE